MLSHFPPKLPTNDNVGPLHVAMLYLPDGGEELGELDGFVFVSKKPNFLLKNSLGLPLKSRRKSQQMSSKHMQIRFDDSCLAALGGALEG
jgi:hypothetical protein